MYFETWCSKFLYRIQKYNTMFDNVLLYPVCWFAKILEHKELINICLFFKFVFFSKNSFEMKNSFKITYAYRVINPTFLWRNNKRRPFFITVSHSISISNASLRRARSFSTTWFVVLVCFTHLHSQNGLKIISIKKNEKKTKKSQKFFFFSSFRAKKPIVHSEHTGYQQ